MTRLILSWGQPLRRYVRGGLTVLAAALVTAAMAAAQAPAPATPPEPAAPEISAEDLRAIRPEPAGARPAPDAGAGEPRLRFQFAGAPWDEVLAWYAEQADLSLQMDRAPAGTVNFVDPESTYSVSEGLDLLNRLLLDRGWTLVRRGRMLVVVDLEVQNAEKLISDLAELVRPEDLQRRAGSDIVKTVFPLGSLSPEDAEEELTQMIGPWGRVIVLPSARQVVVTETVEKLQAIGELLNSAAEAGSSVVEIELQHRSAEEVLEVARPLLGLEPGVNNGDDLRISVGLYGDRLFATGRPGQLGLLEGIVRKADTPLPKADPETGSQVASPVLVTHPVAHADSNTVFDVLQTLLAGTPDARIAIDPKTQAIIASARPETQQLIRETIAELESSGSEFEIIDLEHLAPSQALLTINKFFGTGEEGGDGPIVDGDPATGRLWVRGTRGQIDTVKELIAELENRDRRGQLGDAVRVLPYTGPAADRVVDQLQTLWPMTGRANQLRSVTPSRAGAATRGGIPERRTSRASDERESAKASGQPPQSLAQPAGDVLEARGRRRDSASGDWRFVSERTGEEPAGDEPAGDAGGAVPSEAPSATREAPADDAGPDVVLQKTPSGLVVASQDAEALDTLEQLLSAVAVPGEGVSELPTIYWLRYVKAEVASKLVSDVLSGAAASGTASVSQSLSEQFGGGMLSAGDDLPGASSRSVMTASGRVNIVADSRLNALIVQAGPAELQLIDLILEKLDVQESPEDVETNAKPLLIPVVYQDAAEVAELVKEVFRDKIQGQGSRSGGDRRGGEDDGGQASRRDFFAAMRGGRGGRGGGGDRDDGDRGGNATSAASEPSTITVAVDKRSNSLVVTATPQDFQDVRELVELLDQRGMQTEESVQVVTLGGRVNPEVVHEALATVLGGSVSSTGQSDRASSSSSSESRGRNSQGDRDAAGRDRGGRPDAEEMRERIERIRAMRERGGFGGPGGFSGRRGFGERSGRGGR